MERWTKFEPFLICLSILLGYLSRNITSITDITAVIEEPLFLVLIFFIFLEIDWTDLKEEFLNKNFLITELIINFIWTPILAFLLGLIFFPNNLAIRTALMLLLVLPCTDWYLIFTELTGGNLSLSTSVLPYNLVIQFIILPFCLTFFFGNNPVPFESGIIEEILLELLIPLVLALIIRLFLRRTPLLEHQLHRFSDKIEFVLICLITFTIFSSEGNDLTLVLSNFPLFILSVAIFYVLNFLLSYFTAKRKKLSKEDLISLVFVTTSRNTPLSLTLAGIIFPEVRLISIVLLIGPLTEIPFSLIISSILKKLVNKRIFPQLKINRSD